jgi:hypothetical protein
MPHASGLTKPRHQNWGTSISLPDDTMISPLTIDTFEEES